MRIDPTGTHGPTRAVARSKAWRRVGTNRWVPASADPPPEQRIFDATAHLPPSGALTGWAALRLHEAAFFDGAEDRRVPLALGAVNGRHAREGIAWSYERLEETEVQFVHGLRVTVPLRALFDELRSIEDPRERVVAADMAVAARSVRLNEARTYAAARLGWRRAHWAVDALDRARHGSRSPQESRVRLVWTDDARLPEPGLNTMVFDLRENFVLCADLFDAEAGLVVEFDGAEHRWAKRRARDAERADAARELGLEHTTIVGQDLRKPELVVKRLRAARGRALFRSPEQRAWTTEWPPGWVPWW